nr:hypothetical protein [uncultured Agathobacter sp.]
MSRRKRNRQVAKELENQAVHNVEPVNEHKDINESERIQRAEWIHDQVKLQREREDETWEKIMEEQKLITERMRSIDDDISRNRELERYHEGCLEDITDQVYSLHGVTTDKLEGMTRYKNAKFQGEATVVFVMSIMIAAIAAYAYGVTSQVCMFMLLCIGAEGALLSGPHKKRNLLGGIFRTLFFVPVILMAAEVISFKYYENYYEYVTMIGEVAAILLVVIGTATYFLYNPYRKDKKYVKEAQADLKELHKAARKSVRKNQKLRMKNEAKDQKVQAKLAKKEAKYERRQQKHQLKMEKREFKSEQKKKKMEMKTELKRSKLMAKAMKINKKAGIMPDIQNNDGDNAENINDNEKVKAIEKAGIIENEIDAGKTEQIGSVNSTENINRIQNKNLKENKDLKENKGDNRKHRDKAPEEENLDNPVEYIEQNNIISITKERKIE